MIQKEEVVKVFQTMAGGVEKFALETAHNKMLEDQNSQRQVVKNIQIPILTDDDDVKTYINEFQLQKPKNMIRFFVETAFASFEATKESINDLKLLDLNDSIVLVDTAKGQICDAMNDQSEEKEELRAAKHNLDEAINGLRRKIDIYIDGIRKIDNRSKWQFFLKSRVSLTDIDTNVSCARYALEALITALELQKYIAVLKKNSVPSVVDSGSQFIREKILGGNTCSLMHAYDKDKQTGFWLSIRQKCDSIIENYCLEQYVDEYDDIDFS